MSIAARQAQPPAEMIKNTVALTLVTPAMPAQATTTVVLVGASAGLTSSLAVG
jgi:hypothetical protein